MSTPTILRVNKRKHPFVQIDRAVFEDDRMSWKAKGLLGYLLSRPNDWTVVVKDLIKRSSDGRDSVYAALNELSEFGYAEHKIVREKGKVVGGRWIVHEEPLVPRTTSGKAVSGKAGTGKTVTGKPDTTNNNDPTNKKEPTKKGLVEADEKYPPDEIVDAIREDGSVCRKTERRNITGAYKVYGAVFFADGLIWDEAPKLVCAEAPDRTPK